MHRQRCPPKKYDTITTTKTANPLKQIIINKEESTVGGGG